MANSLPSKLTITDDKISFFTWNWLKDVSSWIRGEGAMAGTTLVTVGTSTVLSDAFEYPIDATSGSMPVTLPLAASCANKKYLIKKVDSTANTVVISCSGADTVDGALGQILYKQYQVLMVISDGVSAWHVINGTSAAMVPPGGSTHTKEVIYNSAGAFASDPNFTWDSAAVTLTVSNGVLGQITAGLQVSAPVINALTNYSINTLPIDPVTKNWIINGACQVAQRPVPNLSTTAQYGSVDRYQVLSIGGTVTAGTITQDTAGVMATRLPYALKVSAATWSVAPTSLAVLHYIESKDAVNLKNATQLTFSVKLRQDTGGSLTYTLQVDKANAVDNFGAVTNITSTTQVVPSGTTVSASVTFAPGDITNGLRLVVTVPPGAVTTKNFYYSEFLLTTAVGRSPYPYQIFQDELLACQRYYQKSFDYATAPVQNLGGGNGAAMYFGVLAGVNNGGMQLQYVPPMRTAAPAMIFYNPFAANAKWRNLFAGADSGAAALFTQGNGSVFITNPQVAGDAVGATMLLHWTADAEF